MALAGVLVLIGLSKISDNPVLSMPLILVGIVSLPFAGPLILIGESTKVFIDIEYNTSQAADSLRMMSRDPSLRPSALGASSAEPAKVVAGDPRSQRTGDEQPKFSYFR